MQDCCAGLRHRQFQADVRSLIRLKPNFGMTWGRLLGKAVLATKLGAAEEGKVEKKADFAEEINLGWGVGRDHHEAGCGGETSRLFEVIVWISKGTK